MGLNVPEGSSFVFGGEYVPDKIIYRNEVTYSVPLAAGISAYTEYSFPHNLPVIPGIIGTYSDDNWATSYDLGTGSYGSLPTYAIVGYTMQAHAWADATNVYIRVISHNTARTISFRLVGLYVIRNGVSEVNIDIPPIQDNLLFTTDDLTLKHRIFQPLNITTDGTGVYQNTLYSTGVDEVLTAMPFMYEDGKLSMGNTMNTITQSGVVLATVTNNNLFQISVSAMYVKAVTVIVKAYYNATS